MLIDSNSLPVLKQVTWIQICASLNYRKKMKAEPSRLIPRKLIANLELIERKIPFKVAKQRKIR